MMPAHEISEFQWKKSTYSGNSGQCVEISVTHGERVSIRDSKYPYATMLRFSPHVWSSFVGGIKAGL